MDFNKANQKELMRVHGIGKVLAKRLIQGRPFASWSEVNDVVQIGEKRLAALQKAFVLEVEVEHKAYPKAADPQAEADPKAEGAEADHKAADPKAANPKAQADPKANANSASSES